jgi:hypothetical protein
MPARSDPGGFFVAGNPPSTVIELRANQFQPATGDAVGPASGRGDGPETLQLAEDYEIEAWIKPAVAGEAFDVCDFGAALTVEFDPAALGEQVQYALFGACNVHF